MVVNQIIRITIPGIGILSYMIDASVVVITGKMTKKTIGVILPTGSLGIVNYLLVYVYQAGFNTN